MYLNEDLNIAYYSLEVYIETYELVKLASDDIKEE